jgi:hypothetical protein
MRRYHIIAVTPDFTQTLVSPTSAGWLLPWLDDNPRLTLPTQIDLFLRSLTTACELVHEAPLPVVAGDPVRQGYCLVLVSAPIVSKHVELASNIELESRPALLSLQRHAWRLALERLRRPMADFDSLAQVNDALGWAVDQIGRRACACVTSTMRHRCSRYEYVVRFETTRKPMYFKGGVARVADEAVLTGLLQTPGRQDVPETLAMDVAKGRWIYRELEGTPLAGENLTAANAAAVIPALVGLQQRSMSTPHARTHLHARRMSARDLFDAAERLVETVIAASPLPGRDAENVTRLADQWRENRHSVLDRCCAVDQLKLPRTMVLSDFEPRNIIVSSGHVGFIDLERCYWSYPCLSLWRFVHAVDALQTGGVARMQIESAFVAGWSDVVAPDDMRRALAEMPLLGGLFELVLASSELDIRERELGSVLPISYRATALAPRLQRLLEQARDVRA